MQTEFNEREYRELLAEYNERTISCEEFNKLYDDNDGFILSGNPNHPLTGESVYKLISDGIDAIVEGIKNEAAV